MSVWGCISGAVCPGEPTSLQGWRVATNARLKLDERVRKIEIHNFIVEVLELLRSQLLDIIKELVRLRDSVRKARFRLRDSVRKILEFRCQLWGQSRRRHVSAARHRDLIC
jgi:hypothetical protein